jgi:hypothetical protein
MRVASGSAERSRVAGPARPSSSRVRARSAWRRTAPTREPARGCSSATAAAISEAERDIRKSNGRPEAAAHAAVEDRGYFFLLFFLVFFFFFAAMVPSVIGECFCQPATRRLHGADRSRNSRAADFVEAGAAREGVPEGSLREKLTVRE